MSKYQTPCRYDFVGSFLRPEEVKKANADYQEKNLLASGFYVGI